MLPVTWEKVIAGKTAFFEWKAKRPNDGSVFDVEVFLKKLSLIDKDVILANVRDITERKKAERLLAEEKERFETLANNAPFGMLMIEESGRFNYINPKFTELFGYTLDDLPSIGAWVRKAYPGFDQRQIAERNWSTIIGDVNLGERQPFTKKVRCRDATDKIINFIPVRLPSGEVLMTCEDITQRQHAENEIRSRNMELTVLNEIVSMVNSTLSLSMILDTLKQVFHERLKVVQGGIFLYDELSGKINKAIVWDVPFADQKLFEESAIRVFQDERLLQDKEVILELGDSLNHPNKSYLYIPLAFKGEVHGIILLIYNQPLKTFSGERLTFFQTLGQQIGVAIENAKLYEQLRVSMEQMQALSRKLVEVQESERRAVARELHDEVGQILTALKLALSAYPRTHLDEGDQNILKAQQLCQQLIVIIRELSLKLRPQMLDDLGLLPALLWHFQQFQNHTDVQVDFRHSDLDRRFPQEVETAAYRIVQEALTNAVRHARVTKVNVLIWCRNGTLGVQIEDKGRGF